jgi:hypothetical protein
MHADPEKHFSPGFHCLFRFSLRAFFSDSACAVMLFRVFYAGVWDFLSGMMLF